MLTERIVDLNSDLGEGGDADDEILSLVTSANVSCGAHAGDDRSIGSALDLARRSGVIVGAHPGYADRDDFGRRELDLSPTEIRDLVSNQVAALVDRARRAGVAVRYIKPHGALYNQACRLDTVAAPIVDAAVRLGLPLLGLPGSRLEHLAKSRVPFFSEGFADRRYRPDGSLTPRSEPGAVLTDPAEAAEQALRLIQSGQVRSLCVHGDHPGAAAFARALRDAVLVSGCRIIPFVE